MEANNHTASPDAPVGHHLRIPVTSFYSADGVNRAAQLSRRKAEKRRLQSETLFLVFPRQAAAFEAIDLLDSTAPEHRAAVIEDHGWLPGPFPPPCDWDVGGIHMRPFSFEDPSTGQRKFVASTIRDFWRRYSSLIPSQRHYYEILREGTPCRLYLDLEFSIPDNPEVDGPRITADLLRIISIQLFSLYGIVVGRRNFLHLDSTTSQKFSRHVILHLPDGALFASAECVGCFLKTVRDCCLKQQPRFWVFPKGTGRTNSRIIDAPHSGSAVSSVDKVLLNRAQTLGPQTSVQDDEALDVAAFELDSFDFNDEISLSDDGSDETNRSAAEEHRLADHHLTKQLFMDMGVYTRNRAFRLYASCKRGKFPHILQPLDNFKTNMHPEPLSTSSHANSSSATKLEANMPDVGYMESDPTNEEYRLFCKSLVCPFSSTEVKSTASPRILPCRFHSYSFVGDSCAKISSTRNARTQGEVRTKSPFPKLDAFVLQHISARSGRSAFIRSVTEFEAASADSAQNSSPKLATLIYEIGGNRWCARLQRQHRSNHVM
eukprot:INCI6712.1.p1 GENE.INCI6712.1~~INCI6712.1.p1  ORF type:complete len:546 (-),score=72.15 INCI6712.1:75-1712(-)